MRFSTGLLGDQELATIIQISSLCRTYFTYFPCGALQPGQGITLFSWTLMMRLLLFTVFLTGACGSMAGEPPQLGPFESTVDPTPKNRIDELIRGRLKKLGLIRPGFAPTQCSCAASIWMLSARCRPLKRPNSS